MNALKYQIKEVKKRNKCVIVGVWLSHIHFLSSRCVHDNLFPPNITPVMNMQVGKMLPFLALALLNFLVFLAVPSGHLFQYTVCVSTRRKAEVFKDIPIPHTINILHTKSSPPPSLSLLQSTHCLHTPAPPSISLFLLFI